MSSSKKYKVIIIEPSLIVQQGIKQLLQSHPEFEIGYCFSDYQTFMESWKKYTPDVLLINPSVVGFHKKVAIRSFFPEYTKAVFIAVLYNYTQLETLNSFDATIEICDENFQIIKKIKKGIENKSQGEGGAENVDLSDREKEILVSVAKGLTNKEIADKHKISIHTVISHRKNITRKTGIKTISGLTVYAIFNNLASHTELE